MSGLSAAHATDRLRRDLDARLNELQQYEKLADVQTMIKSDLKVAEDEYARAPPTLSPSIGAAMPPPAGLQVIAEVCTAFPTEADSWTTDSPALPPETLRALRPFAMASERIRSELDAEGQRVPQDIGQIINFATLVSSYEIAVAESQALEQRANRLRHAVEVVRETRIDFTDKVLVSLTQETNP